MQLPDVFKAYDIRGVAGSEITPEFCGQVGRALGSILPDGTVAVGYDMRPESQQYAQAIIDGLVALGREVWDLGLIPTDMIYFAVGKYNLAGGAVVTASHNPGKYNGIKVVGAQMAELKAAAQSEIDSAGTPGKVEPKDLKTQWMDHALSFVDASKWPAYKVAIDAGNGMGGLLMPILQSKLPLQITSLYFELDGSFPSHPANPVDPKNLADLQAAIKKDNLDFGIAFDGDGDRSILVDGQGRALNGTIMTAMLAEAVLSQHPGATILYSAVIGNIVPETVQKLGGKAVRTKVGHSHIEAAMKETGAIFGGELSGHFYFKNNYGAGSGLIAALMAIEVLHQSGKILDELYDKYNVYAASGEINLPAANTAAVIDKLKQHYDNGTPDELDGLTIRYADWWFNVRPSNTEPLLRLNVEANDQELLQLKQQELLEIISTTS